MVRHPADFLPKTLARTAMHGYDIARWIEDRTDRARAVEEGSLYPALCRMLKRRWIDAEWGTSELGRRARFYRLTRKGRQQLASDTDAWTTLVQAVEKVAASSGCGRSGTLAPCGVVAWLAGQCTHESACE
jgi:PadR family transcriptional regulator, regulatory protein PadR